MEKNYEVKPFEAFKGMFTVTFKSLLKEEVFRFGDLLQQKPDIDAVQTVEEIGKGTYLRVHMCQESNNCNEDYLSKLVELILTKEFSKVEKPDVEKATDELPKEVREGLKKSLIPEASEALYKWYKGDEAHRAVLTMTVDEEKGVVGGEILGREHTLIAALSIQIMKDTQIIKLINKAMLTCAIDAMEERHDMIKSLTEKQDGHDSAAE